MQKTKKELTLLGILIQSFKIEINFKSILNFTKENFNIIVVIPAILGGIWQIIELYNISPSFVRFFSISQIIPDGIILLLIILLAIVMLLIIFLVLSLIVGLFPSGIIFFTKKITLNETQKHKNKEIIVDGILFIFLYYISYMYLLKIVIVSISQLIVFFTLDIIIISIITRVVTSAIDNFPEKFSGFIRLIYVSIIYLGCMFFLTFSSNFRSQMLFPEILTNTTTFLKKYKIDERILKNEIVYMNDKYIFIKNYLSVTDKKGKIILDKKGKKTYGFCISVVKFEDFVTNSYEQNGAQIIQVE